MPECDGGGATKDARTVCRLERTVPYESFPARRFENHSPETNDTHRHVFQLLLPVNLFQTRGNALPSCKFVNETSTTGEEQPGSVHPSSILMKFCRFLGWIIIRGMYLFRCDSSS